MKTIEQIIELIPDSKKVKACVLLRDWESPVSDINLYFEKYDPVIQQVEIALMRTFGKTLKEVAALNRKQENADIRKMIAHYLRVEQGYTMSRISELFERDHPVAIHYIRKHKEHLACDTKYKEKNDKFLKAINHDNESNNPTRAENEDSITTTLDILRHRAYNS